jgi:hypothetical protein
MLATMPTDKATPASKKWTARIADVIRNTEVDQRASSGGDNIIEALTDKTGSTVPPI